MISQRKAVRKTEPSKIRSNRDRVMIALGIFLVLFMGIGIYVSIGDRAEVKKPKGPVKDPNTYRKSSQCPSKPVFWEGNRFRLCKRHVEKAGT